MIERQPADAGGEGADGAPAGAHTGAASGRR
jgi:hypothetical protein